MADERDNPLERILGPTPPPYNGPNEDIDGIRGLAAEIRLLNRTMKDTFKKKFLEVELGPQSKKILRDSSERSLKEFMDVLQWKGMDPKNPQSRTSRVVSSSAIKATAKQFVGGETEGLKQMAKDFKGIVVGEDGKINTNPASIIRESSGLLRSGIKGNYGVIARGLGAHAAVAASTSPAALRAYQRAAEGMYMGVAGGDIAAMQRYGFRGEQGAGSFLRGIANDFLGTETLGYLTGVNLGFGNEAQREAQGDRIDTFRAAFNPFDALSMEDDSTIKGLVRGAGFRMGSDEEKEVIRSMRRLHEKGFRPEEIFPYIELFVKKMDTSMDEVANTIELFQERAMNAGKSLDDYIKSVTTTAQNLMRQGLDSQTAQARAATAATFKNVSGEQYGGLASQMDTFTFEWMMQNHPDVMQDPNAMLQFQINPDLFMQERGINADEAKHGQVQRAVEMARQFFPGWSEEMLYSQAAKYLGGGMDPAAVKELYELGPEGIKRKSEIADLEQTLATSEAAIKEAEDAQKGTDFLFERDDEGNIVSVRDKYQANIDAAKEEQRAILEQYRDALEAQGELDPDEMEKINQMIAEGKDPTTIMERANRALAEATEGESKVKISVDAHPRLLRILDITTEIDEHKTRTERNQRNRYAPGVPGVTP